MIKDEIDFLRREKRTLKKSFFKEAESTHLGLETTKI